MLVLLFQMFYASGRDGLPAFAFTDDADVRKPTVGFFPTNNLVRDFTLAVTVKPEDKETGGLLFAVVNPVQSLISFGLELRVINEDFMNISLYYQDYRFNNGSEEQKTLTDFQVTK